MVNFESTNTTQTAKKKVRCMSTISSNRAKNINQEKIQKEWMVEALKSLHYSLLIIYLIIYFTCLLNT